MISEFSPIQSAWYKNKTNKNNLTLMSAGPPFTNMV